MGTPLRLPRQHLLRHLVLAVIAGVGFWLLTISVSPFHDFQIGEIALYAMAVAGLSVLTGVNGQISIGNGAFMAVGAYTFAWLQQHESLPLAVLLLAAVAAASVLGLIVGMPATRLRGPYLAGMTLVLALGLPQLGDKYSGIFGGDQGVPTNPLTPPGSIDPQRWLGWIQILTAIIAFVLLANLLQSRFGRSMRAVRDNEIAASLAGIHVGRTKVLTFVVSAAYAGLAGAFLALSTGIAIPGEFSLTLSIYLLAAMVLGGAGTLVGAWWGAIAVVYLPEWSTSLSSSLRFSSAVSANLALVIYGLVLIVVMTLAPTGIQGGVRWLGQRALALINTRLQPTSPGSRGKVGGLPNPYTNEQNLTTSESERTLP